MYPSGHENAGVAAIIYLLDGWLNALEDGSVLHWQPDPNYPRIWTEEELAQLVASIDAKVNEEVNRSPGTSVGATAGPEFSRLLLPQRLALAQQLHGLMQQYEGQFPASVGVPLPEAANG